MTTINLDRVKVRILKVNERNLVPSIDAEKLTMSFGSDDVDELANQLGQPRLAGRDGDRRRAQPPGLDRDPAEGHPARTRGPGSISRSSSAPTSRKATTPSRRPTGCSSPISASPPIPARDGMAVAVRSLADAKPVAGVTLRLYARNNGELAPLTSDADGIARYRRRPAARQRRRRAVRGDGLRRRAAISTSSKSAAPPSTCSDRGVSGRDAAGPGRRLSLYRPRHLPAGRERPSDGAGARRQGGRAVGRCR